MAEVYETESSLDPASNPVKPKRDNWEKFEIICKGLGAMLVPLAVGIVGVVWSNQASNRQTAAHEEASSRQMAGQMYGIAIDILRSDPNLKRGDEELRSWAVSVLRNPLSPPSLDDKAANTLELSGFPIGPYDFSDDDLRRLTEIANRDNEPIEEFSPPAAFPPILMPDLKPNSGSTLPRER